MLKKLLPLLLLLATVLYAVCSYMQNGLPSQYWDWRHELVLLSGVQLMSVMSAAMLLAARPSWLEKPLHGLDKMYGLHKQLGIATGLLLACHWLIKLSPKLVMALEWATPKVKHAKGAKDPLMSLAKDMGEWAAWAVLAMVILALLRAVPYRLWRKVHKLFAPLYLMGAFHALILMPQNLWLSPVGALMAALLGIGSICAIYSLSGRIGRNKQVSGQISQITPLSANQLEVICQMNSPWPEHQAGQFALLSFDPKEGTHPYTIASAPRKSGELRFIIKSLGHYTSTLSSTLTVGQRIKAEGPYGGFDGGQNTQRQAWIAGGIGVTPFLAWLESPNFNNAQIDFYYCIKSAAEAAKLDEIQAACLAKNIRLHLIEGQRLNIAQIQPEKLADIWYCGPQGLGTAISQYLSQMSQPPRFHHEAFSMR
ncbi:ferric reductase-like transmembrane domain-containing protein [Iodobacter sp.]|uniref:ferredoxin reductase family protein n=1 Tax=Iodobacter sp. TaxID=1915058 RepID=UPI0025D9D015|nr:ferric reductase-like transmembrane domain-containing protein [Iodobacter sp.]